jgi:uncharacterized protein YutE (UPF0331/DUF86 family)
MPGPHDDIGFNKAAMTGFRNIAIHEYQIMDMSILRAVAQTHWVSLVAFCEELGFSIVKERGT